MTELIAFSSLRRGVLGIGVLSALFFAWAILFHPLIAMTVRAIEKLHDTQFELNRTRAIVAESGKLRADLLKIEEDAIRQKLQIGDSPSSAIGTLQGTINQLARDSGLQLESMSSEAPVMASAKITNMIISLKANGSEAALVRMLGAIENHTTFMAIDRLTVVAQEITQQSNGKPVPGVSIEMRIVGYWARPRGEKTSKS